MRCDVAHPFATVFMYAKAHGIEHLRKNLRMSSHLRGGTSERPSWYISGKVLMSLTTKQFHSGWGMRV